MPRRARSSAIPTLVPAVLLTAVVVLLAGCHGEEATPPAAEPTPLASYDGTVVAVKRIGFCSRIPDAAVAAVVGTTVTTAHYGNGEKLPGTEDLSHEYGCVFKGEGDVVARSWVFVPPVTPARARELVSAAQKMPGCRTTPAARFGSPAVGTVCREGTTSTVTYRGLFGDAWLACSLARPVPAESKQAEETPATAKAETTKAPAGRAPSEQEQIATAGRWCVQVAETAAAS